MLMLEELRFKTDQAKSLQRLKKRQTKDINLTAFVSILIYILSYLHHLFFYYIIFYLCVIIFNNYSPKALLILLNNPRDEVEGIIQQY